jgi:hypothetical protein
MDDILPPDLADVDEVNGYLQSDLQPLTRAAELTIQAVHVLRQLEAEARRDPALTAHLSSACADWQAPLREGPDPLLTILGLVRLTRQRVDHLAELTRIEALPVTTGTLDTSAPRH